MPYDYVMGEDEPAGAAAGFPLGRWLADQRRYYGAGTLEASRVKQLDKLGMVWSHHDVAWEEGLAVARSWAAAHGHFLPPINAAGRRRSPDRGMGQEQARAGPGSAGERRTPGRRAAGPRGNKCPWPLESCQRAVWQPWRPSAPDGAPSGGPWHGSAASPSPAPTSRPGAPCPRAAGELVVQGEDLGAWAAAQRQGVGQAHPPRSSGSSAALSAWNPPAPPSARPSSPQTASGRSTPRSPAVPRPRKTHATRAEAQRTPRRRR
ncbi:Helicase associated domain protein [Streptomyces olivaceoviridis]|uniref:helicase associated domain-containing protein n=1 Tax=Streptomyces olivaceoviridis TaxID=1921 RepID=UPI003690DDD8